MKTEDYPQIAAELCEVCRPFGERGWCLATGGNFSVRVDAEHFLITQSGKDKSRLTPGDLMICSSDGQAAESALTPSAEALLHACLYRHDSAIASVLHTHSVTSTLASRAAASAIRLQGFEMQKAIRGIDTHEATMDVPVIENSQDMHSLCERVESALVQQQQQQALPGFLVRGHGLYAWGNSLSEAKRHIEGLEFLIECAWREGIR